MKAFCLKCKYYFASHDPQAPRGCKKYGLKSKKFPSQIVREQSGSECLAYEKKAKAIGPAQIEKGLS